MSALAGLSVGRSRYRAAQFLGGLRTVLTPSEVALAHDVLRPPELLLFAAMEPRDRRHSMNVLQWLLAGDPRTSAPLRTAALLHDLGKGRLWAIERVAFVLLEALDSKLVDALARAEGPRWRQGLWRLRHHAPEGACILEAVGTDPHVVALVAAHADSSPSDDLEHERLREADRAC